VTIERISIMAHIGKPLAAQVHKELDDFLASKQVVVTDDAPDLVVSLGGDGTMLRAAQRAHSEDALLLGVNMGTFGYLTDVEAADVTDALARVLDGDFRVEERMMIECRRGSSPPQVGLNEVLVERSARVRLVRLRVSVGGERLADFNADGLIVATPTGSTAYALSAGGPIVSPRAHCLVLVPVSAHMIFSRPFVLAPDETVEITVDDSSEVASSAVDGVMGGELGPGEAITVRRHPRSLRLVRVSGPGFLERLRAKLGLPG
jgi:NAD+ kinase